MLFLDAILRQWNVLLFIAGLMGLSAAAQESGAFAWITDALLHVANGSRRRLFVALFAAGAAITILLSNDATAIVLTPIVYRAVTKRGLDPMPFLYGCVFIANTASFGLPFSNPANVLILPHPELFDYARRMLPPQIIAIAINLAVFLFFFRRELAGSYATPTVEQPSPRALRTLGVMLAVAVAYLVGLRVGWPLGPIAAAGAIVAIAVAGRALDRVLTHFAWQTLLLLAGLFVAFDVLMRAGFARWVLHALESAEVYGRLAFDAAAATGAALLSNVFNNLPIAVASSYVAQRDGLAHLAYPLILGVDLGPNLAISGSLATILWVSILRKYGLRVDALQYVRLGALVVPPAIGAGVLWLWFVG